MVSSRTASLLVALVATASGLALTAGPASGAARACKTGKCDTAPPSLQIVTPAAAATIGGTVTVSGSAADNVGVATVTVSVDGGAARAATGTAAWSLSWTTATVPDGAHTLTVRASDAAGNATTTSRTVTVSNADTTAPQLSIATPAAGASVSGVVTVSGSATDNVALGAVAVQVDGGSWQAASGTSSWSWTWDTSLVAAGLHTILARATDIAGNSATTSRSVTVPAQDASAPSVSFASPAAGATVAGVVTVSGSAADDTGVAVVAVQVDGGGWQDATGTSGWSWTWDTAGASAGTHSLTARATDIAGHVATTTRTVSVADGTAPATQGSWVAPEGVKINVDSAGAWTIAQVYSILKANALDLDRIGPGLSINVQDQWGTQTQSSVDSYQGTYSGFRATIWLQGVYSGFSNWPDYALAHEYGHAWSTYWYYMRHGGSWASYQQARWTTADGAVGGGDIYRQPHRLVLHLADRRGHR